MTDKPTPIARLRALVKLAGKTSAEIWEVGESVSSRVAVTQGVELIAVMSYIIDSRRAKANAAFIAAARNAIPDLEAVIARVAKLEARLGIDHCFKVDEHGEKFRYEIPSEERDSFPDGIECRDDTIKILDGNIKTLRAARAAAESALAALRGQVEAEREACARIADNFPPTILQVWERPGGPPGNGYRQTNGTDIAAAIRARAALATPARPLTDTEKLGALHKYVDETEAQDEPALGFHWRYGWHFRREADNSVCIFRTIKPENEPEPIVWNVPANEWASILAALATPTEEGKK